MKKYLLYYSLIDLVFLVIGFLSMAWLRPGAIEPVVNKLWIMFLFFAGIWLVISLISGKYLDPHKKSLVQLYSGVVIADIILLLFTAVAIFIFRPPLANHLIALGTGGIVFVLEVFFATYVFYHHKYIATIGKRGSNMKPVAYPDIVDPNKEQELQEKLLSSQTPKEFNFEVFRPLKSNTKSAKDLVARRLKDSNRFLFDLINRNISLDCIKSVNTQVLNTRTLFNIQTVEENTSQLFINLHQLNDIRRINQFLIQVNLNLVPGGYMVGCALTKEERKNNFFKKHRYPVSSVMYGIHFVTRRILPKVPVFKEIYFALTKGEGRVLSRAEVLGRLFFCGFELVETSHYDEYFYFIVQKVSEHRIDAKPSYGPLFKMGRVGKGGKIIYVYKLRTMHPYSEYLQSFMVKNHGYDNDGKGKIENDFRVSTLGKFFRKYWLDELPQIINVIKGEMNIVGVRPLSLTRYIEFPEEVKKMRIKLKPGCIPPYVSLLMSNEEDNIKAELIYLKQREKHPVYTDIKFFVLAIYNILTNKIRSA